MIRHIVLWNHAQAISDENARRENAGRVKAELEALRGCVEGIRELRVVIDPMPSSNADIMLTSLFESAEALAAYQSHPAHKKAGAFVAENFTDRRCFDCQED